MNIEQKLKIMCIIQDEITHLNETDQHGHHLKALQSERAVAIQIVCRYVKRLEDRINELEQKE